MPTAVPSRGDLDAAHDRVPPDELAAARSTLVVDDAAAGRGAVLTYTWWHPDPTSCS